MTNAIIIPGNGNTDISENWFPYAQRELEKLGIEVRAKNMPDPELARAQYWLPFIEHDLKANEDSILIGHSSGAVAIMRYLETHKVKGAVLVGVYYTDFDMESEKASGYFDAPWKWDAIKANAGWIAQFTSTDDPYIPIQQARYVHDRLNTEYHEYHNKGHFGSEVREFPEIIEVIKGKGL
ncbi:MAG: alpha/beta hydrolase [bacterium]